MPRSAEFYGMVIEMYYDEHEPPHSHVLYGGSRGAVAIAGSRLLRGRLPRRVLTLVREWAGINRVALEENWDRARKSQPLRRIRPLE